MGGLEPLCQRLTGAKEGLDFETFWEMFYVLQCWDVLTQGDVSFEPLCQRLTGAKEGMDFDTFLEMFL